MMNGWSVNGCRALVLADPSTLSIKWYSFVSGRTQPLAGFLLRKDRV